MSKKLVFHLFFERLRFFLAPLRVAKTLLFASVFDLCKNASTRKIVKKNVVVSIWTWPKNPKKRQNKNFARVSPFLMPPKCPQKRRSLGNPRALGALPCFFFTALPPPGWSLINQHLSFTPELPHLFGAARHQTWAVNIKRMMEEQHAHAKKNQQLKRNRRKHMTCTARKHTKTAGWT